MSPSAYLIAWSGVLAIYAWVTLHMGGEPSDDVGRLWELGFALLVANWVRVDSRPTHYRPCFEYEMFVLFAWPLVLCHYLMHTRGVRRDLVLLGAFGAGQVVPTACAALLKPVP